MNGMSNLISFLPVAFVAVVIVYEKFRQKRIRNEYDEMQLEIRGRGAWYGFYAIILYWAACFLMENAFGFCFLTPANTVFLGVMISGSVIVGYSILHDSYYGMNRTGYGNGIFLAVIALIEAVGVVYLVLLARSGTFADLRTPCRDERLMIVLCMPIFSTILAATLIRRLKPDKEGEE